MFRSIRWRIAVPYTILILATMLGLGIYLSRFVHQIYIDNLQAEQTALAQLLAEVLRTPLAEGAGPETLNAQAERWAAAINQRITIIAPDGTVLGESEQDYTQMENHGNRPEIMQALAEQSGSSTRFSRTLGRELMYTALRVGSVDDPLGIVRVGVPLENIQATIVNLQAALFGTTLLATIVTLLLATWIAGRTTRPLRELTEAADKLSFGELDERIVPATPDEVGRLTQAFNLMAVKLRSQIVALETERSKIAAVLSQMSDGVLIVDNNGVVQMINPAAESMFGIEEKNALHRSLIEVLRNHQLVELWQRCLETGDTQTVAVEIVARRLYLQGVAIPLGEALPGSTLLLFQNLTRVRHLETVRRDFISNISHELRTPLASLKALTETLQEGALEDPPAARRFLQRMETEVDALSLMVSELLELSRIESGRVPLQMEDTSPCDLIHQAVERLRLQAERAGLILQIECDPDLPPVLADAKRLEQVLVNLLHNAIKFTPMGGTILVRATPQSDDRLQNEILFSVRDSGVGIPPEDLARIFERFYKADRARTGGGTGLGLAIARHLVGAHGGKIWAESQRGEGSTFYFTIPTAV